MSDRLWIMKVVVEKDRKFICVIIRKILCLENFPLPSHNQQAALRSVSVRNTFVAFEYNIRGSLSYALFWDNWNLLEVSSQFEYSLRRRANARNVGFLSLLRGNLIVTNSSDAKFWCFSFPLTPHCSFFRT